MAYQAPLRMDKVGKLGPAMRGESNEFAKIGKSVFASVRPE